jgi:predicted SAM-dependent methyltransferase
MAYLSVPLTGSGRTNRPLSHYDLWTSLSHLIQTDRKASPTYMNQDTTQSQLAKLHLGCGWNELAGWLNTDHLPVRDSIIPLDVTQSFPFENESFCFIYTEHMIEHVTFAKCAFAISECFRILKKGGKIRISTPDLHFLFRLYSAPDEPLHRNYMNWSASQFIPSAISASPAHVINNFVRNWGHTFIYDYHSLSELLASCGFSMIRRYSLNESDVDEFRSLENEKRMPSGFLQLESLIVEAEKA